MKIKGLFLGITLCIFLVACSRGGGGDSAGTTPTDTRPSFDSDISPKNYVQNEAITPFILPEASGGNGDLTYNLIPLAMLPAGLEFDSGTRRFSGTPTTAGSTTVLYTATDADGDLARLQFSIEVRQDLKPRFTESVPYLEFVPDEQITPLTLPEARGGDGDSTYSLTPNSPATMLPAGLEFDGRTRVLNGTPTELGSTTVTYVATDADGDIARLRFIIEVTQDFKPRFTDLVQYQRYTQGIPITPLTLPEARGGDGDSTYSLTPNFPATMLPAGLEFDSRTRVLSGTPTALGSTTVTYTAMDEDGDVDMFMFRIELVANEEPSFTGHRRLGITALQYIQNSAIIPLRLPLALGEPPVTYGLTPDSPATMLPDGLMFDSGTRVLSGTPTTLGTTSVTYTVTDTDGDVVSFTFNIVVRPPVPTGICDRTQQVQDAILEQIGGTTTCSVIIPEHLASITQLELIEKGLTSLQPNDFYGLTGLSDLDLRDNMIATLPEDIFYGLSDLTTLTLFDNDLTTLHENLFDGLLSLSELRLHNNDITDLPEDVFDGLSDLSVLGLSSNSLTTLHADVFDGLSGLTWLDLSQNSLMTLHSDMFDGTSLTTLRLHENSLMTLPSDAFTGLSSLSELYLHKNDLTDLHEDLFDGLSNLKNLLLRENSLTILPSGVFDELSSLENLDLQENSLETLPSGVFTGLSNLEWLWLQENSLETLPSDIFTGLSNLEWLYLQENSLETLPSDIFTGLSSLERLYLYNNDLTTLHADVFDGLSTSLKGLYLFQNSLETLPEDLFAGLSSLEWLWLQENSLMTLPSGLFAGLSSLSELYLNNNDLTILPSDVFAGLSSLERLYLYHNDLTTLPESVFNGLSSLMTLGLSHNNIGENPTICQRSAVTCN